MPIRSPAFGNKLQLAAAVLEGDFQQAVRGYTTAVCRIEKREAGCCREQFRGVGEKPQNHVGIEQQAHSMYARNSPRGSSKSSRTTRRPSYWPALGTPVTVRFFLANRRVPGYHPLNLSPF